MNTQNRFGVFIFATTKKHAEEILTYLPLGESALILGETPQDERTRILNAARTGKIRYLVNIAIISVGVDVPAYDTLAYLRPTESLVLMVQTMGRALRLSPKTEKEEALILDFAGNIERHKDWDNPVIMKAVARTIDKDKPLVIKCPKCMALNPETARRCIGVTNKVRCDYFFEFKECDNEKCGAMNDIASRLCRICNHELIDPNAKLSMDSVNANWDTVNVITARYGISGTAHNFRINVAYECIAENGRKGMVYEYYTPKSEKARRVFYGQFVKKHCNKPSEWYPYLDNRHKVQNMLQEVNTPNQLMIAMTDKGIKIKKKLFEDADFYQDKSQVSA